MVNYQLSFWSECTDLVHVSLEVFDASFVSVYAWTFNPQTKQPVDEITIDQWRDREMGYSRTVYYDDQM